MLFSQYFLAKFFEEHVFGIRERWRHFALVGICNKQHPTQCAFVSHTYIVIYSCSKKKITVQSSFIYCPISFMNKTIASR